jgi:hypothetical protein
MREFKRNSQQLSSNLTNKPIWYSLEQSNSILSLKAYPSRAFGTIDYPHQQYHPKAHPFL